MANNIASFTVEQIYSEVLKKMAKNATIVGCTFPHVGFMQGDSAVASYTLTGNERSFIRAKHAATLLAGRFNLKWGAMSSWHDEEICKTIIDNMMNRRLLFWKH